MSIINTIIKDIKYANIYFIIGFIIINNFIPTILANPLEKNSMENITIDSHLHLTKNHIPLLQKALVSCKDRTTNNIIIKTIETLHKKEIITASDMEQILIDLEITQIQIYFLRHIHGHGTYRFLCFPGMLIASIPYIPYLGPSILIKEIKDIQIDRLDPSIHPENSVIIGFLGLIDLIWNPHGNSYLFNGIGFLTIIKPYQQQ